MTMPHDADEELLGYETEQEETAPLPIEPVPVRAVEPVVTVPTVAQHLTCRTVVLADASPVQILAQDPLRTRAQIVVKGANDVVLCHSITQAQDAGNADPTLARPNGAILPGGGPVFTVTATGPVWLVGNTFPTRVGLILERRSA